MPDFTCQIHLCDAIASHRCRGQEYRKLLTPIGKKSTVDGSIPMKNVEYWSLIGIVVPKGIKVRTVLRRVGDGNITF